MARDALILFMRSLPEGCSFSVISFGSKFSPLLENNSYQTYDDGTRDYAISLIESFEANFGGTKILEPL